VSEQPTGADKGWDARLYGEHGRFVGELGAPVVMLLAPRPGEDILDIGCGDGFLSRRIAEAGARVVGIDASPDMVAAARAAGIDAHVADAQQLVYQAAFDAVFSNAALHWMPDLDAVFRGVHAALRPGGRLVAEMGGHGNIAAVATAIRAVLQRRDLPVPAQPWTFPSVEDLRQRLEGAGFRVTQAELIPRPTPLTTGIRPWLKNFANHLLAGAPESDRDTLEAEIEALLAPALRDGRGNWTADYVRLRFAALR
jgi:SAM-dependent methyltransferase